MFFKRLISSVVSSILVLKFNLFYSTMLVLIDSHCIDPVTVYKSELQLLPYLSLHVLLRRSAMTFMVMTFSVSLAGIPVIIVMSAMLQLCNNLHHILFLEMYIQGCLWTNIM